MQIETDPQHRLMCTTHFSPDWQHSRINAWNRTADRNVLITGVRVGACWHVCLCISHLLLLNIEETTTWLALAGWRLNSSPSCLFPSNLLKWNLADLSELGVCTWECAGTFLHVCLYECVNKTLLYVRTLKCSVQTDLVETEFQNNSKNSELILGT